MATGTRLRVNFIDGQLSDALTDAGTTMDSPGLENLPVIDHASDDEYLALSIGSEVVHVTTHTADATSATIERGQEDSTAAAHEEGAAWEHAPTARDFPVVLTESEYGAITPDPETIYVVMEDPE